MSRNAAGAYTLPGAYNPVVSGTTITSDWANFTLDDIQTALTDSLDRNGRGAMLAALKAFTGTTAVPGISFDGEAGTGFSRPSAGQLSVSVQTTEVLRATATYLRTLVPLAFGVEFDQTNVGTGGVAKLNWNATDGTLNLGVLGGNITHRLGQDLLLHITNNTGATLNKGEVVHITGSTGTKLNVAKAQANSYANNVATVGIMAETVANAASGFVCVNGTVRDLDTSAFTDGQRVYLSAATAGLITGTQPTYPNNAIAVGWVERAHPTAGTIFVKVVRSNMISLAEDVTLTSLAASDILQRNGGNTAWVNVAPPAGGFVGVTASQTLTNKTLTAPTVTGAILNDGYTEEVAAMPASAIDAANGSIQTRTISGNTTFTENLASGQSVVLVLVNGNTATVTWPTVTWVGAAGNVAPTLTALDIIVFTQVNSTVYAVYCGKGA